MDLDLKGRVTVITGPAKGMGAAITMAFAAEGARLALLGRDVAASTGCRAGARLGAEAIVDACDLTEPGNATSAAANRVADAFGRIDILVNVAGGSGPIGKTVVETTPEEFDDIVTLNMNGCFHTMRAVLPTMMAHRYGKIVNVGGTFGLRGRAGRMAYSASKWGLRGITKSFALEVGSTTSTSIASRPAWSTARVSATRSAPTWRSGSVSARRGVDATPPTTRSSASPTRRCRQCLPVPGERRLAPDHRHRSSGRWRLGHVVREGR